VRRELDLSLLVAVGMAIFFGITMIYSAASGSTLWRSQAIYAVVAILLAVATVYFPDKLFLDLAFPLYALGLMTLLAVLAFGTGIRQNYDDHGFGKIPGGSQLRSSGIAQGDRWRRAHLHDPRRPGGTST
jgi:hypothetical protein